jgi:hypothetical protein
MRLSKLITVTTDKTKNKIINLLTPRLSLNSARFLISNFFYIINEQIIVTKFEHSF